MSLATRCPSCSTTFRVVQDQLKVCDGWVRCGRCDEVFSALAGLFDLERDSPPDRSPETPGAVAAPVPDAPLESPAPTSIGVREPEAEGGGNPMHADNAADTSGWGILEPPDESATSDGDKKRKGLIPEGLADREFEVDLAQAGEARIAIADPEFVRHAWRRERWTHPGIRITLAAFAMLLLGSLGLQAMHHFRDDVASHWPETTSTLSAWCEWAGCRVEAPRRLESITVESSTLNRANARDSFRLSIGLRNRSATRVAMPDIELSLTDSAGHLLTRRALTPADFRVVSTTVQPGAESNLQLLLSAGGSPVTGYTVEIFYP